MTIDIPENATVEEKLLQLTDALELIKTVLAEVIDEMDSDGKDIDSLEEAVKALKNKVHSMMKVMAEGR